MLSPPEVEGLSEVKEDNKKNIPSTNSTANNKDIEFNDNKETIDAATNVGEQERASRY